MIRVSEAERTDYTSVMDEAGETINQRLKRYVDNPVIDTLGWMTMYLQNQPAVDLKRAREAKLYF